MINDPIVSVVMPVYNGERYLRAAIESILGQTLSNFKFLILDDGSTDISLDIARSYKDSRIHVFAEPHRGLEAIRNRGLVLAQSPYVAWMDADDISAPDRLQRQVEHLNANPKAVAVGTWAVLIDQNGEHKRIVLTPPTKGLDILTALPRENPFVNGSSMVRRHAALEIGGYRQGFAPAEDYDFWFRVAEVGELANIGAPLYWLRIHPTSTSASAGVEAVEKLVERVRRDALARYLHRHAQLKRVEERAPQRYAVMQDSKTWGLDDITLSDWALSYLTQPKLCMGDYLLLRAVSENPLNRSAWSIARRRYLSRASARTVIRIISTRLRNQLLPQRFDR